MYVVVIIEASGFLMVASALYTIISYVWSVLNHTLASGLLFSRIEWVLSVLTLGIIIAVLPIFGDYDLGAAFIVACLAAASIAYVIADRKAQIKIKRRVI